MNTTYCPMDYPPLCAYTHWFASFIVYKVDSKSLVPEKSYGHESPLYKSTMRNGIILMELIVFVPAVMKLLAFLYPNLSGSTRRIYLFTYLLMPSLIYVDHGHFHPNSAVHGFVLWAVYFALTNRFSLAVVFMVFAVNFKQMALYFALPFAVYTLSILWKQAQRKFKSDMVKQIGYLGFRVVGLGLIFVLTTTILWWPWVQETLFGNPEHGVASVIARIFPFRRGLFEDYVATFWCLLDQIVKVHEVLSHGQ